jgi:hypothetical protein
MAWHIVKEKRAKDKIGIFVETWLGFETRRPSTSIAQQLT